MSQLEAMRDLPKGLTLSFAHDGHELSVTKVPHLGANVWVAMNRPDKSAKPCLPCAAGICPVQHEEYDVHIYRVVSPLPHKYIIIHAMRNPVSGYCMEDPIRTGLSYDQMNVWFEEYVRKFIERRV